MATVKLLMNNTGPLNPDEENSTYVTLLNLNIANGWTNGSFPSEDEEYVFDRTDVRAIFITLYTVVFCCCFFGNLLVILVVTLSRRLRSITNFFLANLAVADLCVGIFCVFQNLSIYLIPSWVFGDFLCKMYQFVHSLSYTASIFILVVICTERYFAIIHPITCKQILTSSRLKFVIVGVWVTSALYSAPKFVWVQTITNELGNNETETICISHRKKYDSELFDIINFCFLYLTPLCIISVLYTRIAVGLWQSSQVLATSNPQQNVPCGVSHCARHCTLRAPLDNQISKIENGTKVAVAAWRLRRPPCQFQQFSHLSQNVIRARRRVIRMLIVVVMTFAICNLPFHARKMWQYWSSNYQGGSQFSTLFTPLTFLITYFNSAVNPMLYAFLSRNFRRGMRELIFCNFRASQKKQRQLLLKQNSNNQIPSLLMRCSSTKSTKANCSSVGATSSDTCTG